MRAAAQVYRLRSAAESIPIPLGSTSISTDARG